MKMTDTDPEVRRELVGTVRRFINREVIPVASELEHADTYPEAIVEQMKALGLFGIAIPEDPTRGRRSAAGGKAGCRSPRGG